MDKLVQAKTEVVLNLIRTNNKADEALKLTQAFRNMVEGEASRQIALRSPKTKGAGA